MAIKDQEKIMASYGAKLIGGAMLAWPSNIGTEESLFLVSASDTEGALAAMEKAIPALEQLGSVISFKGDIGLASLVDIAFVQTLFFGLAGHEMAHLLMEQYGATHDLQRQYLEICKKLMPFSSVTMYEVATNAILTKEYAKMGEVFNTTAMLEAVDMHLQFMKKMGVTVDNYAGNYIKYLKKVRNKDQGSSQVIEFYIEGKDKWERAGMNHQKGTYGQVKVVYASSAQWMKHHLHAAPQSGYFCTMYYQLHLSFDTVFSWEKRGSCYH